MRKFVNDESFETFYGVSPLPYMSDLRDIYYHVFRDIFGIKNDKLLQWFVYTISIDGFEHMIKDILKFKLVNVRYYHYVLLNENNEPLKIPRYEHV